MLTSFPKMSLLFHSSLSSHGSGGLRSPDHSLQRHSYHGTDTRESERMNDELMNKLPSRQLGLYTVLDIVGNHPQFSRSTNEPFLWPTFEQD